MGYPMTYDRVVSRNMLGGDYDAEGPNSLVKGDLRRLERDAQDDEHIRSYAHHSGATEGQVRLIFKMFFEGPWPNWRDANPPRWQRECVHQVCAVPEGWKLVPVVLSEAMLEAAAVLRNEAEGVRKPLRTSALWLALLDAAPDYEFVACNKQETP